MPLLHTQLGSQVTSFKYQARPNVLIQCFFAAILKIDDLRIRRHLSRTEQHLRSVDTHALPEPLRIRRLQHLNRLHTYWRSGRFPRHHESLLLAQGLYSPRFIDRDGRLCAVADLLINSGHGTLAHQIAATANLSLIRDMNFPELNAWVDQSGLTLDELALIQPGYIWKEISPLLALIGLFVAFVIVGTGVTPWNQWLLWLCVAYEVLFFSTVGFVFYVDRVLAPRRETRNLRKVAEFQQRGDTNALVEIFLAPWSSTSTQYAARDALVALKADRVKLFQDPLLHSPLSRRRIFALSELESIHDPRVLPILEKALAHETDDHVRRYLEWAISGIMKEQAKSSVHNT